MSSKHPSKLKLPTPHCVTTVKKELHPKTKRTKSTKVKKAIYLFCVAAIFSVLTGTAIHYYSYLFARNVKGKVVGIDRVTQATTIIGGSPIPANQLFSFAIAIREDNGEIVTSSSEDRQWAVVEKGQCAEARYFPYPPWILEKSGTYFGARLLKLYTCD